MDKSELVMDVVSKIIGAKTYLLCLEIVSKYLLENTTAHTVVVYLQNEQRRQLIPEICLQREGINRSRLLSSIDKTLNGQLVNPLLFSFLNNKEISVSVINDKAKYDVSGILILDAILGVKSEFCQNIPLLDENGQSFGVLALIFPFSVSTTKVELIDKKVVAIASQIYGYEKTYARNTRLIHILNNTSESLRKENDRLKKSIKIEKNDTRIIGRSSCMKSVGELIRKVTHSDVMVLVLGETGTGKELVAGLLHELSDRKDAPFVVQNCAAIPENLLESELFGYRKGAFSGANNDKMGLIEQANGGTLFLDEIGDMPLNLQAKLLRVLQEKTIRPLGASATSERSVDVRFVSATHQDLLAKVKTGDFREDLYYRLAVFPIKLPPLRERREDIPELISHFIQEFTAKYQKKVAGITPLVMNILMKYHYPGNIRDLRNIIERAVLLVENGGYIDYPVLGEDVMMYLNPLLNPSYKTGHIKPGENLKSAVDSYEANYIRETLKLCNWNQTKAAERLGIARRTIIEKIQKYQINRYITELDSTLQ